MSTDASQKEGNGITASVQELIAMRPFSASLFRKAERKSSSPLTGGYSSPFRGRGIDFSEVRIYQPGDDIRSMDWRVTARTGKPHTKLFIEERERPVYFVVDFCRWMHFGTRVAFKSVVAARIAALLAWAAVGHGDRVGGFVVNESGHHESKASGGHRGATRLLNILSSWSKPAPNNAPETTDVFNALLARVQRVARPGSLVYFISDFSFMEESHKRYVNLLSRHCDLVAVNVYDPIEAQPPDKGILAISNGEHTQHIDFFDREVFRHIQGAFTDRQKKLTRYFLQHGVHVINVATNDDLVATLRRGLAVQKTVMGSAQ